jgi:DNA-binding CsgD family transcriptional regulator
VDQTVTDFIARLDAPKTEPEFRDLFKTHVENFGFRAFTYVGMHLSAAGAAGKFVLEKPPIYLTTVKRDWEQHYVRHEYQNTDPLIMECLRRILPLKWNDVRRLRNLSPAQDEIMKRADDFGMRTGLIIPVHGPGGELGLLSLMSGETDKEFNKIAGAYQHAIHIMAIHYHNAIQHTLAKAGEAPGPIELTARESECLLWTAHGKTSWEISLILHISERTVNFHLANAMKKLGVFSKTHAVAKMFKMGIAHP